MPQPRKEFVPISYVPPRLCSSRSGPAGLFRYDDALEPGALDRRELLLGFLAGGVRTGLDACKSFVRLEVHREAGRAKPLGMVIRAFAFAEGADLHGPRTRRDLRRNRRRDG